MPSSGGPGTSDNIKTQSFGLLSVGMADRKWKRLYFECSHWKPSRLKRIAVCDSTAMLLARCTSTACWSTMPLWTNSRTPHPFVGYCLCVRQHSEAARNLLLLAGAGRRDGVQHRRTPTLNSTTTTRRMGNRINRTPLVSKELIE